MRGLGGPYPSRSPASFTCLSPFAAMHFALLRKSDICITQLCAFVGWPLAAFGTFEPNHTAPDRIFSHKATKPQRRPIFPLQWERIWSLMSARELGGVGEGLCVFDRAAPFPPAAGKVVF